MKYLLANQGVFRTIQGEGFLLGTPMIFVRLGGCSVGCPECDTDYKTIEKITTGELIQRIENVSNHYSDWIWITGGEPTDQNLEELIVILKKIGHKVALATSGIRLVQNINLIDWLSVSPHTKNIVQDRGDELKIIIGLNQFTFGDIKNIDINKFKYKYIQLLWDNKHIDKIQECVNFVLNNKNDWRLTIQAHKYWRID